MTQRIIKRVALATRVCQVLGSNLPRRASNAAAPIVVYYPPFEDLHDLADHIHRAKWYIPSVANATVVFALDPQLGDVDIQAIEVPKHHRKPDTPAASPKIVACDCSDLDAWLSKATVVNVWNARGTGWLRKLWRSFSKLRLVDPEFYQYTETHTNAALLWYDLLPNATKTQWKADSMRVFDRMFHELGGRSRTYLFGTGPSIAEAEHHSFDDGVRIVCNTIVANEELLEELCPQIVTFVDSAFHFGVSKYSARFATDLLKAVRKYGCYCVTNEVGYALMRAHYPELSDKLIGVPAKRFGKSVALTPQSFRTRSYGYTILTRFMLPLGAGLSNTVALLGFDGRKPEETYFWKHNPTTQYSDSMKDVWRAHNAFFRDTDYAHHYECHCTSSAEMVSTFERMGKRIEVLGNSYVPVFRKRMVQQAPTEA